MDSIAPSYSSIVGLSLTKGKGGGGGGGGASPKDALPTKCDLPPISSATENNAVDKYDIDFELPTNFKRGPYVFDSGASAS